MIVLHEGAFDAELRKPIAIVRFGKPSPRITVAGGTDDLDWDKRTSFLGPVKCERTEAG